MDAMVSGWRVGVGLGVIVGVAVWLGEGVRLGAGEGLGVNSAADTTGGGRFTGGDWQPDAKIRMNRNVPPNRATFILDINYPNKIVKGILYFRQENYLWKEGLHWLRRG